MPDRRPGRPTGRPPHPGLLTPAEHRVLEHAPLGCTNAEIGDALPHPATTAVYVTESELRDSDRMRMLIGVALGVLPRSYGAIGPY